LRGARAGSAALPPWYRQPARGRPCVQASAWAMESVRHAWWKERMLKEYHLLSPRDAHLGERSEELVADKSSIHSSVRSTDVRSTDVRSTEETDLSSYRHGMYPVAREPPRGRRPAHVPELPGPLAQPSHVRSKGKASVRSAPRDHTPRNLGIGTGAWEEEVVRRPRDNFDHQGCLLINPGERRRGGVPAPGSNILAHEEVDVVPKIGSHQRTEHFDHTGSLILTPGRRSNSNPAGRSEDFELADSVRPGTGRFARYIFDHSGQMIHNVNTRDPLAYYY